jgi:hypothetical protein
MLSKLLESRRRCARHLKTKNGRIVVKITEIKKCIEPELNSNFIVLKTGNGFFERFSFLIDPSGIYCVSTANSLCLRSTVYGHILKSVTFPRGCHLSLVNGAVGRRSSLKVIIVFRHRSREVKASQELNRKPRI